MIKLNQMMKSDKCYGCGACVNFCKFNAIDMKKDPKGFYYPKVDENKCIQCDACYSVCPAIEENRTKIINLQGSGKTYSIRHQNTDVRKKSSSGGLFTALSDYILNNNGVVCGVVWDSVYSVCHTCAETSDERELMVQSKYIQSNIKDTFKQIKEYLLDGRKVLFTGTPCQVAGLKLFLSNMDISNLYLCDVLCGGNVSPGLFESYIKYIEKKNKDEVVSVCFRTKKYGWKQYHISVKMKNSIYEGARKDNEPFFDMYLSKLSIRDACFNCTFASKERISDITIGDFWGIDKVDSKIDDDIGISLAIANTTKGMYIIDSIREDIYLEEREIDYAVPKQINLRNAPKIPPKREVFWKDYVNRGGEYVLKKYTTFGVTLKIKNLIVKILKKFR